MILSAYSFQHDIAVCSACCLSAAAAADRTMQLLLFLQCIASLAVIRSQHGIQDIFHRVRRPYLREEALERVMLRSLYSDKGKLTDCH